MSALFSEATSRQRAMFYIGVDGGGTGTRVVVSDGEKILARATGGPAALSRGVQNAWITIGEACAEALARIGETLIWKETALGIGLAGAHHADWKSDFLQNAPSESYLVVTTDSHASLLGAHMGRPGICVAVGTGSVGEVLDTAGVTRVVGGFGFPAGDEASGAWLGLRAAGYTQRVIDGRVPSDQLAADLFAHATDSHEDVTGNRSRDLFLRWHCAANATDFASLAPTLFRHADHPFVRELITLAVADILVMIETLDPSVSLEIALVGSIGRMLRPYFPTCIAKRIVTPKACAAIGALTLVARDLDLTCYDAVI